MSGLKAQGNFSATNPNGGFGDFGSQIPSLQPAVIVPPSEYELRVNSPFERQWARYRRTLVRSQSAQIERFSALNTIYEPEFSYVMREPMALALTQDVPLMVQPLGIWTAPDYAVTHKSIIPSKIKPAFSGAEMMVIRASDPNAKTEEPATKKSFFGASSAAASTSSTATSTAASAPASTPSSAASAAEPASNQPKASFIERAWPVLLVGVAAIALAGFLLMRGRKSVRVRYAQMG